VAIFYVRPNQGGSYGSGDGSSYANAWNGIESVNWDRLNAAGVASTLWVCGTHKRRMQVPSADYGGPAFTGARRYDGLVIRGDYPGDPGVLDVRGLPYRFLNRALSPGEGSDLSQFLCGSPAFNQAYTVALANSRNVTLSHLTIHVPGIPLACTPTNHPGADRMSLYYPPGSPKPCAAAPYNGASIIYPYNIGVYSNSASGNIRVTGCRIVGDKAYSRIGVGLQSFLSSSSCSIDGNDIGGCMKAINMDAGTSRSGLAWYVNGNTIRDLGFSAGDDDYVDGMDIYGVFNANGNHAEVVGNDISGFCQDGIDLFYTSGILVKGNYVHDARLAYIKYMDTPHWNADEQRGDQNGIKFGGDGGLSDANQIRDNVVANIYGAGITNNGGGRNATVSGNVVVASDPSMGASGIHCHGRGGGNAITNNVVIGYKKAIAIETNNNQIVNNLLQSAPKLPLYVNGSRPQADLLIWGGTGQKVGGNRYLNDLVVIGNGGSVLSVLDAREILNVA
jgi:parallel beta helix pectate lyase-like protein